MIVQKHLALRIIHIIKTWLDIRNPTQFISFLQRSRVEITDQNKETLKIFTIEFLSICNSAKSFIETTKDPYFKQLFDYEANQTAEQEIFACLMKSIEFIDDIEND